MSELKKIGAKIVVDGESEFRQSINNSKAALKQFDSELKLTQAQFKNNEKSMDALKKVQQTYIKQQSQLQKQEKAYVEQLEKASKTHKEATKIHENTAKNIQELRKELEKAKEKYGENSKQVEKLNTELEKSEKQYKKEESAINGLENKMSKWETSLNDTRTALVEVDNNLEDVNKSIDNYDKGIEEAGDSTAKAAPEIQELHVSISKLATADIIADDIRNLANALVDLASSAIDIGMEFETSMSKVEALSGASGQALTDLTEKAREMGATTMFSASEAADAMSYMALAGWDDKQMLEGIEPVLNLAAAANMDLAEASDIVTDYLTAFGLKAKDASKFTDQLAYAMANSNTDVEMLGEAYKNCAAAAGSMGYSVEDVTSALMTMANAGVKGGEAGTSLRSIMINLATDTNGCASALEEFGVHVYDDVTGNMNSLSDILIGTASAFEGLGDAEANALAKTIAGKTQFTGFETILLGLNDAAKESGMSFQDYAEALQNCDGYAKEMADTMQDNLQGKLTILDSSLQALGESVYSVFSEDLKDGVEGATNAVSRLNEAVKKGDLNVSLKKISQSLNGLIDKVVDWTEKQLPNIIEQLSKIIDNADEIIPLIEGIIAGLLMFKTTGAVISIATTAMQLFQVATGAATLEQLGLNAAMLANPYALLLEGVMALIVGLEVYSNAMRESNSIVSERAEATRKMTEETKELNDTLEEGAAKRQSSRQELEVESGVTKNLVDKLKNLQEEYKNGADNMTEMKNVIEQLNTALPELNLSINEQTGELNMSTEAIDKNVEAMLKQAKVEAAREDLIEIAKAQYEAEKKLAKQKEVVTDAVLELNKAEKEYSEDAQTHVDMNGNLVEVENEYSMALENAKNNLQEARTEEGRLKDNINELSAEYETATNYINDNTNALAENSGQVESTSSVITTKSAEWVDAYADAYEAALKSLSGQSGLFTELSLQVDTSISQMTSNLNSQTEVFSTFASDLQKASELANKSSDPEFKAIVANIESMGVDGAGYLHELVAAAETDSEEFNELMKSWAEMQDAKSTLLETMATFEADFTTGVDTLSEKQIEFNENFTTSNSEMLDTIKEDTETKNGEIKQNVEDTMTGIETAIENAQPIVQQNSEELANAAKEPVESTINHDTFYEYGEQAGQGLADGLRSMVDEVRAAAQELADAANTAVSGPSGLDEHSPSKKMHEYGRLGGVGLAEGFEESLPDVVKAINNTLPNENNVNLNSYQNVSIGANTEGNGTLAKIENTLNEYLPVLSQMKVVLDTGTTVGALASPMNKALGRLAIRSKSL